MQNWLKILQKIVVGGVGKIGKEKTGWEKFGWSFGQSYLTKKVRISSQTPAKEKTKALRKSGGFCVGPRSERTHANSSGSSMPSGSWPTTDSTPGRNSQTARATTRWLPKSAFSANQR